MNSLYWSIRFFSGIGLFAAGAFYEHFAVLKDYGWMAFFLMWQVVLLFVVSKESP